MVDKRHVLAVAAITFVLFLYYKSSAPRQRGLSAEPVTCTAPTTADTGDLVECVESGSLPAAKLYVFPDSIVDQMSVEIKANRHLYCPEELLTAVREISAKKMEMGDSGRLRVLDVGANLGSCGIGMGMLGHKVTMFEPMRAHGKLIQRSIVANRLNADVTFMPIAIGDSDKAAAAASSMGNPTRTVPLYREVGNFGNSIVNPVLTDDLVNLGSKGDGSGTSYEKEEITISTLDWVLGGQQEKIDFMKIDTQGHELKVLLGARHLFKSPGIDVVFAEYAPGWVKSKGDNPTDIVRLLINEYGFTCHRSGRDSPPLTGPEDERLKPAPNDERWYIDLVCYKKPYWPTKPIAVAAAGPAAAAAPLPEAAPQVVPEEAAAEAAAATEDDKSADY